MPRPGEIDFEQSDSGIAVPVVPSVMLLRLGSNEKLEAQIYKRLHICNGDRPLEKMIPLLSSQSNIPDHPR
jgi:hypothetical protein